MGMTNHLQRLPSSPRESSRVGRAQPRLVHVLPRAPRGAWQRSSRVHVSPGLDEAPSLFSSAWRIETVFLGHPQRLEPSGQRLCRKPRVGSAAKLHECPAGPRRRGRHGGDGQWRQHDSKLLITLTMAAERCRAYSSTSEQRRPGACEPAASPKTIPLKKGTVQGARQA